MSGKDNTGTLKSAVGVLGLSTVALLASTIGLAVKENNAAPAAPAAPAADTMSAVAAAPSTTDFVALKENSIFLDYRDNVCAGAQLAVANKLCADLEVPTPQAGGNVTKGYVGDLDVGSLKPHTDTYFQGDMCPVNVHWHLGTEHYSYGQYDENGNGPHGTAERPEWANRDLAAVGEKVRGGFHCHHYDEKEEKFTKPYDWKYCTNMEVGETYEVHWPHSSVGDCGTVNQYQTPFYDGVFCNLSMEQFAAIAVDAQNIASNVGVHGQVFTVVNDEQYFYPDMMRGMIIDKQRNMGTDIHYYTGSTTGTSRSNEMCSQYAPITWQVDRQCHMISASSFDKLCHDMLLQRDDMKDDLYPHGSRELVMDSLVANNAADAESLAAAAAAAAAPAAEAAPEEAPAAEEAPATEVVAAEVARNGNLRA
jgi:ribosomal protein L12E/L44/L45/RPP1/RPP2